ncbi:MAG: hypothetical protein BroJett040_03850 [Oligoflexia bacterium]|nr:MAG: hypothetical protein BroJett040_03850 [Oligoflexia bacterium]
MKKIIYAISFLLLNACVEVQNKNSNPEESPAPESHSVVQEQKAEIDQQESTHEKVQYSLIGGKPNQYEVQFKSTGYSAVVKKTVQGQVLIPLQSETWSDTQVVANEKYTYQFGEISDGKFQSAEEVSIQIPTDQVVSGVINIDNDEQVRQLKSANRIFFTRGTTITTMGRDILIAANEVYFDDVIIQSWPKGSQAFSGANGMSGGHFTIKSKLAQGKVVVYMRGQNGVDGVSGKPYKNPMECIGLGNIPECDFLKYQGRGIPGTNATNGGDSGVALIQIQDMDDLHAQVYHEIGIGGKGGKGGPGMPEQYSIGFIEPRTKVRDKQPDGPDGQDGINGHFGQTCYQSMQPRDCR